MLSASIQFILDNAGYSTSQSYYAQSRVYDWFAEQNVRHHLVGKNILTRVVVDLKAICVDYNDDILNPNDDHPLKVVS